MMNVFPTRQHPDLPSDAAYSPDRDVAYVVPAMISQQLPASLAGDKIPAWLKSHIDANRMTEADLQRGVEALVKAVDACSDLSTPDAMTALRAAGFVDMPDALKLPPFAVLGMLMFSYYFQGVRFAMRGDKPHKVVVVSGAVQDALAAGLESQRKDPWLGRFLRSRKGGR